MIPRMAHSITFGILIMIIIMIIFARKDLRLGGISIATIFSYISFDIFFGGTSKFPFLIPFNTKIPHLVEQIGYYLNLFLFQ